MALRQRLLAKQLTATIGLAPMTEREPLIPEDVFRPETLECLSSDLALDGTCPVAYNEDAFRYFLDMERRRAELSGRPLLLLLVDFKKHEHQRSIGTVGTAALPDERPSEEILPYHLRARWTVSPISNARTRGRYPTLNCDSHQKAAIEGRW